MQGGNRDMKRKRIKVNQASINTRKPCGELPISIGFEHEYYDPEGESYEKTKSWFFTFAKVKPSIVFDWIVAKNLEKFCIYGELNRACIGSDFEYEIGDDEEWDSWKYNHTYFLEHWHDGSPTTQFRSSSDTLYMNHTGPHKVVVLERNHEDVVAEFVYAKQRGQ